MGNLHVPEVANALPYEIATQNNSRGSNQIRIWPFFILQMSARIFRRLSIE